MLTWSSPGAHLWKSQTGDGGAESEPDGAEPSTFLPVYPDGWRIRGEEDLQEDLLHPCCPAEGNIDQSNPASVLEYWVYRDDQNNVADCPVTRTVTPPSSPVTSRPRLFIPVSSSTDPCSPSGSPWDTPPVSAAAHLHLLGESLSLIGHHLQETDKMVSVPGSLSLLLDSLLCALAPLICLTTEIPELRSCTQHTLSSTLENISYVMPGMELCGRVVRLNNMVVLEEILCSVSSQERLECNCSLLLLLKQPGASPVGLDFRLVMLCGRLKPKQSDSHGTHLLRPDLECLAALVQRNLLCMQKNKLTSAFMCA